MRTHLIRYSLALSIALTAQLRASTPAIFNGPLSILMPGWSRLVGVADFDRDLKLDFATVALVNEKTITLSVYGGKGNAMFRDPLVSTFGYPTKIDNFWSAAGDIDGNGVQDIVVGHSGKFQSFLGKGDGTFEAGPMS